MVLKYEGGREERNKFGIQGWGRNLWDIFLISERCYTSVLSELMLRTNL